MKTSEKEELEHLKSMALKLLNSLEPGKNKVDFMAGLLFAANVIELSRKGSNKYTAEAIKMLKGIALGKFRGERGQRNYENI